MPAAQFGGEARALGDRPRMFAHVVLVSPAPARRVNAGALHPRLLHAHFHGGQIKRIDGIDAPNLRTVISISL